MFVREHLYFNGDVSVTKITSAISWRREAICFFQKWRSQSAEGLRD